MCACILCLASSLLLLLLLLLLLSVLQDKSAAAFRQIVHRVQPSFDLHHPDPAVLVLKRQKIQAPRPSPPPAAAAAAAAAAGGGGSGTAAAAAGEPAHIQYVRGVLLLLARPCDETPSLFGRPALAAVLAKYVSPPPRVSPDLPGLNFKQHPRRVLLTGPHKRQRRRRRRTRRRRRRRRRRRTRRRPRPR